MIFYSGFLKLLGIKNTKSQIKTSKTILQAERVEPFGFTTKPPKDNQAFCLFLNGDKSNGIHFLTADKEEKPPIETGEIAIYIDKENYILLKKNSTEIKRGELELSISENKLNIKNSSTNLLTVLEKLINEITNHTTPTIYGPQLTTSAPTFQSILNELKGILK